MARRRRRRNDFGDMLDIIRVGAVAPPTLALGTGLASQIRSVAAHPATGPAGITGAVFTGTTGAVGLSAIDIAFKKAKKGMK